MHIQWYFFDLCKSPKKNDHQFGMILTHSSVSWTFWNHSSNDQLSIIVRWFFFLCLFFSICLRFFILLRYVCFVLYFILFEINRCFTLYIDCVCIKSQVLRPQHRLGFTQNHFSLSLYLSLFVRIQWAIKHVMCENMQIFDVFYNTYQ